MSRHYLSPERKVLKTGLAVIEYLRYKYFFSESSPVNVLF